MPPQFGIFDIRKSKRQIHQKLISTETGPAIRKALASARTFERVRRRSRDDSTDIRAAQNRVAHDQHIHPGAQEAIERLARLAHHGLIFVERGVQQHRHPG